MKMLGSGVDIMKFIVVPDIFKVQGSRQTNSELGQTAYPLKPHSSLVFCRRSLRAHIGTPLTWLYAHIKQLARASWMQVLKGGWYVSSKSCAVTCRLPVAGYNHNYFFLSHYNHNLLQVFPRNMVIPCLYFIFSAENETT